MYKIAMTTNPQSGSSSSLMAATTPATAAQDAAGSGDPRKDKIKKETKKDKKVKKEAAKKESKKENKKESKKESKKDKPNKKEKELKKEKERKSEEKRAMNDTKVDEHSESSSKDSLQDPKLLTEPKSPNSRSLPPLFWYMETGAWGKATERAKRHPRELKTWAVLKTKSSKAPPGARDAGTKRLALHHACFKLRTAMSSGSSVSADGNDFEDPFIEVCKFIILLLELHPEAAGVRETRHGCLPLHLAAFASCTIPVHNHSDEVDHTPSISHSGTSTSVPPMTPTMSSQLSPSSAPSPTLPSLSSIPSPPIPSAAAAPKMSRGGSNIPRPKHVTSRSASESTTDTTHTNFSAMFTEENLGALPSGSSTKRKTHRRSHSAEAPAIFGSDSKSSRGASVSMGPNVLISERREDMAVQVLNALLDAFPRAIRMDSEGGRLPLHTACAGRATPGIISTLVTAYPSAARHRNKDGFLPLHLAAHWGISHPNVVINLLKAYPDATFGRNRWERTPLEEALVMAGENGRPHQSALVRALRKHPSYWTRPADIFNKPRSARERNQIVDIDITIPSNEDESTVDESPRLANEKVEEETSNHKRRGLFRKGGKKEEENPGQHSTVVSLSTLIRNQDWKSVLSRLERNPRDAQVELNVTTRGGFISAVGFSPLHYACERRPPLDVVEALIKANPTAVTTRTMPGGCLPLHIACTWYASASVVNALVTADRGGCKTADELGNLPLHCACFSGTGVPVVETLLRAYPKSVLTRNHQGSLSEDITDRLRHSNRRSVLGILHICKEEILLKKHRKSMSSGSMNNAALAAADANKANAPPIVEVDGIDYKDSGMGVEVTYGQEELMWI